MNVYDFDKTLYPRDSTLEFYLVSLLRHPSFLLDLPRTALAFLRYRRGRITMKELREISLSSFRRVKNIEEESERFWRKRKHKIFAYYERIRREDDVIISASPELFLVPIAREAGFGRVIASPPFQPDSSIAFISSTPLMPSRPSTKRGSSPRR